MALATAWRTITVVARLAAALVASLGPSLRWLLLLLRLLTFTALTLPAWLVLAPEYLWSPDVVRGVAYGPHRRNDADVYVPRGALAPATHGRPVIVCVPGGAWVIGYRAWVAPLCRVLAAGGCIAVAVDYRQWPQVTVSGMVADVATAVDAVVGPGDEDAGYCGDGGSGAGSDRGSATAGSPRAVAAVGGSLRAVLAAAGADFRHVSLWGQSAGAHLAAVVLLERAICDTLAASVAAGAGADAAAGAAGTGGAAPLGRVGARATAADASALSVGRRGSSRRRTVTGRPSAEQASLDAPTPTALPPYKAPHAELIASPSAKLAPATGVAVHLVRASEDGAQFDFGDDNHVAGAALLRLSGGTPPARAPGEVASACQPPPRSRHGSRLHASSPVLSAPAYGPAALAEAEARGAAILAFPASPTLLYAAEGTASPRRVATKSAADQEPAPVAPPTVTDIASPARPRPAISRFFGVSGQYDVRAASAAISDRSGVPAAYFDALFEGALDRFSPVRWLPACVAAHRSRLLSTDGGGTAPPHARRRGDSASRGRVSARTVPPSPLPPAAPTPRGAAPPLDASLLPPTALFHGTCDACVPAASSEGMRAALAAAGADASLTLWAGATHTDPILEGPMAGGRDTLADEVLAAVWRDVHAGGAGGAAAACPCGHGRAGQRHVTEGARMVPAWMLALARGVNPF